MYVFNLTPFAYNLSYFFRVYLGTDPYSEYRSGSGSTKVLNRRDAFFSVLLIYLVVKNIVRLRV